MYLLLLADLDVYEEFIETVYPIIKVNCMYNKGQSLETRGEDFFKKSKCNLAYIRRLYRFQYDRRSKKLD